MRGLNLQSPRWTPEQDEVVIRWYRTEGPAWIGYVLGKTKHAVIGRANRLGLSKPTKSSITRKARRIEAAAPAKPANGKLVPLLKLTASMCRWPVGHPGEEGFGFCGLPSLQGKPYCREHDRQGHTGTWDVARAVRHAEAQAMTLAKARSARARKARMA